MNNKTDLITIFTATYNRSNLLLRLFESLKKQTNKNFEWVIVDDGSTDNTTEIVQKIIAEVSFKIVYKKQENQGKHIAINTGISIAKGNYFFIVDSDDRLPKNALEIIGAKLKKVKDKPAIAGVVGLKCYFNGTVVGSKKMKNDVICSQLEYRYLYNNTGDRAEVVKTSVFRQFLFPKFGNENFVPESIVWNRMAQNYKMLYFPENVYECEYLDDGLSSKSAYLRMQNPIGATTLYAELEGINSMKISIKIKAQINFWRFFLRLPKSSMRTQFALLKNYILMIICFPVGNLLFLKDTIDNKKKR